MGKALYGIWAIALIALLLTWCPDVRGDECVVKERRASGAVVIELDGEEFGALPVAQLRELTNTVDVLKMRNRTLEIKLKAAQDLLNVYEARFESGQRAAESDNALIAELKTLKDDYRAISHDYRDLSDKYRSLTDEYNVLMADYGKLTEDYKTIAEQYRGLVTGKVGLNVDLGVGLTGNDERNEIEPAALVGAGYKWIRVWGFLQQNNSGMLVGASIPLF